MKILWLSHFIPYPPKGGVLQRGYHLLKQTARYHEVHLLAFNQKELIGPLFNSVEEGVEEARSHLGKYCSSVEFMDLPCDTSSWSKRWLALKSLFTSAPYTMNWLLSPEYGNRIAELVKEHNFDFVHFDTISLAPFLPYCSNIPNSLDHHNIESHMLIRRASKESNFLKRMYFLQEGRRLEKFEKEYCPQFNFNFTCSDVDTQRLEEISPASKVHTIANGVDTEFFKPNKDIEKKERLIFVGTLSWYPNIEAVDFIAENIWPLVKEKYPNLTVDIIGANPPRNLVELSEKEERFNVHGFVDDILGFLHEAKCYVCPIKDGGGTKLKIVDALSIGMAIVADEIACEGIEVTDGKDVLFAQSGQEYLTQISKVLEEDSLRESLEDNARILAESTYSYDAIGKQLSDLFDLYGKEKA